MTFLFRVCRDAKTNASVGLENIVITKNDNIHKCLRQLSLLDKDIEEATQALENGKFHQPSLIYKKQFPPKEENKTPKKTDKTRPGKANKPPKQGARDKDCAPNPRKEQGIFKIASKTGHVPRIGAEYGVAVQPPILLEGESKETPICITGSTEGKE